MADDAMAKRGKGLEEEYFHRKEQELIEKLAAARVGSQMKNVRSERFPTKTSENVTESIHARHGFVVASHAAH